MASRFVQQFYRGLVNPLVAPKSRFSSGSSPSTTSGSSKKGNYNNEMTMTILKVAGGFLPGVYIGHVLSDQGVMEPPDEGKDGDDKDKDGKGKDKKADGKDEGAMDKAKDKGKDVADSAKEKLGDAKESVNA